MVRKVCIAGLLVLGYFIALSSALPTVAKFAGPAREPDVVPKCPANFFGLLVYPHNCRLYVDCATGEGKVKECDILRVFDPAKNECVWPEDHPACEDGGFIEFDFK